MLPAAHALCYSNPMTGVRTCTGWQPDVTGPGASDPPGKGTPNLRPSNPPATPPGKPYEPEAPASYVPTPDPSSGRGCFGNLPFGLENCVCEGAEIGEAAGLAACSKVFDKCGSGIQQFSLSDEKKLKAVQRACDSLSAGSCVLTGKQLAMTHPMCAEILKGKGSCSAKKAQRILERSLKRTCDPLCPECSKPLAKAPEELPSDEEHPGGAREEYPDNKHPEEAYPDSDQDEQEYPVDNGEDGHVDYETPEPHPVEEQHPVPETRGCDGNLPFGLEDCVCDGAEIGEAAGIAACSAVFSECQELTPFSSAPEAISRACDELAHSTCRDTATQFALQAEPCAKLLFKGNSKCTPKRARKIFDRNMKSVCEPICPECTGRPKF